MRSREVAAVRVSDRRRGVAHVASGSALAADLSGAGAAGSPTWGRERQRTPTICRPARGRDLARASPGGDRVPMADLVLASASPYRRDLLSRLGVKFECVAPEVDEDAERKATKDPIALARTLARKKAEAVAKAHKKAIVIGCDQVIALDDVALGKPGTAPAAKEQLKKLAGK